MSRLDVRDETIRLEKALAVARGDLRFFGALIERDPDHQAPPQFFCYVDPEDIAVGVRWLLERGAILIRQDNPERYQLARQMEAAARLLPRSWGDSPCDTVIDAAPSGGPSANAPLEIVR